MTSETINHDLADILFHDGWEGVSEDVRDGVPIKDILNRLREDEELNRGAILIIEDN